MDLQEIKKNKLPKTSGCYQFINKAGDIIYIGKAANLKSRVFSYWQKSTNHSPAKHAMMKQIEKVNWVETDSEIEALLLESNLIKKHQPVFNISMRDDKRYVYIKISIEDEIPGVFMTRKISKSGKYFGPFVSTEAVRQTLKAIRKIWPYCTTRKIQSKPCFYYQINRCLGICGGVVNKKEYKDKVIKPIVLFLEGKKERIVKSLKKEKKDLEKKGKTEEASRVNYSIKNMEMVLAHANVLSLMDKYSTDVIELAKVLGLPKTPNRIEGYDISNMFGNDATGSMVVFFLGEENKKEYRKFKIKINKNKANDVGMLKEVLIRRFKHSGVDKKFPSVPFNKGGKSEWPLPDLIIVDGGKAQLNAGLAILKKNKLEIPIIAISKGLGLRSASAPDKLFFPGEKRALELPLASPALHLIKRVRDEAHRFAIGYHKKLRKKKLFK